jgi:hypothetical protein
MRRENVAVNKNLRIAAGRSRLALTAVLTAIVASGVLSRVIVVGEPLFDKYLGDALYAAMLYCFVALAWPTLSTRAVLLIACALVLAIEAFQLTGVPAAMRLSGDPLQRLVSFALGTEFSMRDIVAYAVGLAAIAGVDSVLRRR